MKKFIIIAVIVLVIIFIVLAVRKYNRNKKELAALKKTAETTKAVETAAEVNGVKLHSGGLTTTTNEGVLVPLLTIAEIDQLKQNAIQTAFVDAEQ